MNLAPPNSSPQQTMSTSVLDIPLPDDGEYVLVRWNSHEQRKRLQLEVISIHQQIRSLHAERKQCKRRGIARGYEVKVQETRRREGALQHRLYELLEELAVLGNEVLNEQLTLTEE